MKPRNELVVQKKNVFCGPLTARASRLWLTITALDRNDTSADYDDAAFKLLAHATATGRLGVRTRSQTIASALPEFRRIDLWLVLSDQVDMFPSYKADKQPGVPGKRTPQPTS